MTTSIATQILDGKAFAADLEKSLRREIMEHPVFAKVPPRLEVIWIGGRADSRSYVMRKKDAALRSGIILNLHQFPASITRRELEECLARFNADPAVDGIIVQSPISIEGRELKKEEPESIFAQVDPAKDVDGFHPDNHKALEDQRAILISCTPLGALNLIFQADKEIGGMKAVVIGRSKHVGTPMAMLLRQQGCEVTVIGSRTHDEDEKRAISKEADILVAATGQKHMIDADWVKPGAILIDIGITPEVVDGKNKIFGDIDPKSVEGLAGYMTPMPGGTGPMTVMALLINTVIAAHQRRAKNTALCPTALQFWQTARQKARI